MEPSALLALEFEAAIALVARRAAGPLGEDAVRRARPTPEARSLEAALREVEEMARLLDAGDAPPLGDVGDPRGALARLSGGGRPLEPKEILALLSFLGAAECVRESLGRSRPSAPSLAERAAGIPDFGETRAALARLVEGDGSVPDRASPRLGKIRREIEALDREVASRLERLLAGPSVRRNLRSATPVRRDGRSLLAVKSESRGRVRGLLHDRSASGATVFVEPEELVEPGNRLEELRRREAREVAAVLLEATRRLLARRSDLEEACGRLAALDAAFAKARFARDVSASVPLLDGGRILDLREARHPLLLDAVRRRAPGAPNEVVPIDVRLGGDFDVLLVTGPNTGGKTVALKTAGLLASMALAGFPIPAAAGARIPVYEALFVDIGDEQEIAQSLSTFSSHVRRIEPALARAGPRSLVLLDELGAGTDPAEGSALARAILERLLARGASVIATTHLGPLKSLAYVHRRVENASVEFDAKTLRPLYRLRIGLPGESNALAVAERLGLPREVTEAARASLVAEERPLDRAIAEVRDRRIEAEEAREGARRLREEAAREKGALELEKRGLAERRRRDSEEADRAIEDSFRRAREILASEIETAEDSAFRARLERLRDRLEEAMRATPLGERRLEFLKGLRKDDLVYLPRFRQRCPVRRVDFAREVVAVLLGGLRMEVPFEEVSWVEPPGGPK